MRKYTDSLDCRNISTAGAKMYGYSNLPSLSGKKRKSCQTSKSKFLEWKFFLIYSLI